MGATARIMAYLGLDASGFKTNIDGAISKVKSMDVSMRTIRRMTGALFAIQGFSALKGMLDELKAYQKTAGIKLMSDEDVRQLDAATESVKRFSMVITAEAATGMSRFLQGWKAFWAGVATGFDRNAMAEAIEDIESLDAKMRLLRDSIATLEKERFKREAPGKEQVAKAEAELARLNRERFLIGKEQRRPNLTESETKKLAVERLENEEARLKVEKELSAAYALQSKDLKDARDAQRKIAEDAERTTRAINEAEDAKRENLASVEQTTRARVRLAVPETTEEERTAERLERMTELQAKFDEADRKLRRLFDAGQAPDESEEVRNKRLSEAMTQKNRAALAIIQERIRVKNEDRDLAEAEGAKVDQEVKQRVQKRQRRKDIITEGEERKQEIAGGVGASGVRGIEMPGGLQSIGGYFAGADASRSAQDDTSALVQEQIAEVDKQILAELKRINEGD